MLRLDYWLHILQVNTTPIRSGRCKGRRILRGANQMTFRFGYLCYIISYEL